MVTPHGVRVRPPPRNGHTRRESPKLFTEAARSPSPPACRRAPRTLAQPGWGGCAACCGGPALRNVLQTFGSPCKSDHYADVDLNNHSREPREHEPLRGVPVSHSRRRHKRGLAQNRQRVPRARGDGREWGHGRGAASAPATSPAVGPPWDRHVEALQQRVLRGERSRTAPAPQGRSRSNAGCARRPWVVVTTPNSQRDRGPRTARALTPRSP